jgi:hypothetical protein
MNSYKHYIKTAGYLLMDDFIEELEYMPNVHELEDWRAKYLGTGEFITWLMLQLSLRDLSKEDAAELSDWIAKDIEQRLLEEYEQRKQELKEVQ